MDRIPEQTGYLVLNEDGAVISSSGDLENDERSASVIMGLVSLTSQLKSKAFQPDEAFKNVEITYDDHIYTICLSNRKYHIIKKTLSLEPLVA